MKNREIVVVVREICVFSQIFFGNIFNNWLLKLTNFFDTSCYSSMFNNYLLENYLSISQKQHVVLE